MGVAKPVTIGSRRFPRQGDALAFFKEMLSRYEVGHAVADADSVDLSNLLSRHRNYEEKRGSGIHSFVVMDDGHGGKCFGVFRVDGTIEDFTYIFCVTQRW